MKPRFDSEGAAHYAGTFTIFQIEQLREHLEPALNGRPGKRLSGGLAGFLNPLTAIATSLIGEAAFPVRAVVFDKTPDANWSVAWHQDRTIAVRERVETEGFGPWSSKDGICHVAPPVDLLAGMVTLRLHLDDCAVDNAPLKVALGSHRQGFVAADQATRVAEAHTVLSCIAEAGDVWAYSTLILHASKRSLGSGRRRVLQVDYAVQPLPGRLEWRGLN